jgi:hypothetical protein
VQRPAPSRANTKPTGCAPVFHKLVIYSGSERYPLDPGIEAIGVRDAAQLISDLA